MTSIDLSDNKIKADDRLFDLIQQAKCLYLMGNPLIREVNHYRRTLVARMKNLMYLDQRTVDREEKIMADAWLAEGDKGYRKAREEILAFRNEKRKEERK